ncbi:glutamate-ammonia-ligase adenylyltransferase [Tistlia consotensis]|uniref:Bifunctional glutamine synthetase adenylyltransferase/adenylyl-removing enzyme n=2 Tax=Tistlia TaxID=1321364 RepID=A0A1Y6C1P9_9PROT|nr:glutamate-ammonia-ligase adenylyltransferase [Tistlia consotensis USBA 355]SNR74254.1 glutamate-ammonia-ligase adenylyltransferase [Tistlia consotensis]
MLNAAFAAADWPQPADPAQAELARQRWSEAAARLEPPERARAEALAAEAAGRRLLDALFGSSPFLTDALLREPVFTLDLLRDGPDAVMAELLDELKALSKQEVPRDRLSAELRRAKRRAALAVGLADVGGLWALEAVTGALSELADAALDAALAWLLAERIARGDLELPASACAKDGTPLERCGYFVLAMGKYGARELNYSSDVDLIVFYEPGRMAWHGRRTLSEAMVRMTEELARLIDERTAEGYVFRTDLRLRPDPGATPLAISVDAALAYYESAGQNWERAAMIKARVAAGDRATGDAFLRDLKPFVWRKHLDFWAIQDVHSIKRQIQAVKGGAEVAVEGHNVKLGRGGIREIEFFCQTQQLIFGGRDPRLRDPCTLHALQALADSGHVEARTAKELAEAYRELRRIEHRLQMVDDRQTHSLPDSAAGIARIATFLGYPDGASFRRHLLATLHCVEGHYGELFEEAPPLSGPGNLVFTGGEPDPGTVETLARLGFKDGERVFNIVRAWHHGRYRATRSARARELLTELMPALLEKLGQTREPDEGLARFDAFLGRLPEGVQLFSLLYQNPSLLDLLAEVMGRAPALAEHLGRNAALLEAVIDGRFLEPSPGRAVLQEELARELGQARDFQDCLDIVRRWANDRRFLIGIALLRHGIEVDEAGVALSDVAETCIAGLLGPCTEELARNHGHLPGPGLAVLALGKLGGRDMTVSSDLDLVFLYEGQPHGGELDESDGPKPLPPSLYYGRLAQRLISALSALTGEGRLYEVDPRLRPSGSAGPIALSRQGFLRYQQEEAWVWEHMALTRARVVVAEPALQAAIEADIRSVLTVPREPGHLVVEVDAMRERIAKQYPGRSLWDCKYLRGALYDLDFLAQYLQLRHAAEHPEVLCRSSAEAFGRLAEAGLLDGGRARFLAEATRLWRRVQGFLRLTVGDRFDEVAAPPGLKAALARAAGAESFEALQQRLMETAQGVSQCYSEIVAGPARRAQAAAERAAGAPGDA